MNLYVALAWIMFIGLFPLAFFWFRRAWLIGIRKDYSYVALKKGKPPEKPERYEKFSVAINLIAGLVLVTVILLVLIVGLEYRQWTAIAGVTIWLKFLTDFALSRHAHMKYKK